MASPEDDLNAFFDSLSKKVKANVRAALEEQAEKLNEAQRQALRAQLQPPEESGDLEGSIRYEDGANDLEVIVLAGGEDTEADLREGSGMPYDYSLAFEFGNSHQPARPFFYPPYREMRDDIQEAIADAVEDALK
jgi:HK97 gp10 family phage protein